MICNFDFFLRFSEEAKGEVEVEVLDEEEVKVVVEERRWLWRRWRWSRRIWWRRRCRWKRW